MYSAYMLYTSSWHLRHSESSSRGPPSVSMGSVSPLVHVSGSFTRAVCHNPTGEHW